MTDMKLFSLHDLGWPVKKHVGITKMDDIFIRYGSEETMEFQQEKQTGYQSSRCAAEQNDQLRCSHL